MLTSQTTTTSSARRTVTRKPAQTRKTRQTPASKKAGKTARPTKTELPMQIMAEASSLPNVALMELLLMALRMLEKSGRAERDDLALIRELEAQIGRLQAVAA